MSDIFCIIEEKKDYHNLFTARIAVYCCRDGVSVKGPLRSLPCHCLGDLSELGGGKDMDSVLTTYFHFSIFSSFQTGSYHSEKTKDKPMGYSAQRFRYLLPVLICPNDRDFGSVKSD